MHQAVRIFFYPTKLSWSVSYSYTVLGFFLLESSKLRMSVPLVRAAAAVDKTSEALLSSFRSFHLRTDEWILFTVYM